MYLEKKRTRHFNWEENTDFKLTDAAGVLTFEFLCDIDHHAAARMRGKIDFEIKRRHPDVIRLDFTGVGFMDSSGVGLIMGRAELTNQLDRPLTLCGFSYEVRRLVRLCGIHKIKNVYIEA